MNLLSEPELFATASGFDTLLVAAVDELVEDPILGFVTYVESEPVSDRWRWLAVIDQWELDIGVSLGHQVRHIAGQLNQQRVVQQMSEVVNLRGWIYTAGVWFVPADNDGAKPMAGELWRDERRQQQRFACGVDETGRLWQYMPSMHDEPEPFDRDTGVLADALRLLSSHGERSE